MAKCDLCPFNCEIEEGEVGACKVRGTVNGEVSLLTYGHVTTMIEGPIEQKPLYHFQPGMRVLSIGSSGCNMFCTYCQNFEISQVGKQAPGKKVSPDEVVQEALARKCGGIAFTYSEPFVWFEYVMDVAEAARKNGLKTVLKTNGYGKPEKFSEMLDRMDAVNIDVKGSAKLYKEVAGIDLPEHPFDWVIFKNAAAAYKKCHLEISTILIPPYCGADEKTQDEFFSLFCTLSEMTSEYVPLHLLKFAPDFKLKASRPPTDDEMNVTAKTARELFKYVYVDYAGLKNVCRCDNCHADLAEWDGIVLTRKQLVRDRFCFLCGKPHYFS